MSKSRFEVVSIPGCLEDAWKSAFALYPDWDQRGWSVLKVLRMVTVITNIGEAELDKEEARTGRVLEIDGSLFTIKFVDWSTLAEGGKPTLVVKSQTPATSEAQD